MFVVVSTNNLLEMTVCNFCKVSVINPRNVNQYIGLTVCKVCRVVQKQQYTERFTIFNYRCYSMNVRINRVGIDTRKRGEIW